MYGVNASKKTFKLKKAYNVNASKKTEKLKKCYVVDDDKKLVKLWSSFNPAFLVGVANKVYRTEDGSDWSNSGALGKASHDHVNGFAYVNGKYYIQVGINSPNGQYFYSSEDGITWTQLGSLPSFPTIRNNFKYFEGRFIVYTSGSIYYSTDCITWTCANINLDDITYMDGDYPYYQLDSIFCLEYGKVNGITGYYLVSHINPDSDSGYVGCALVLFKTFSDLISEKSTAGKIVSYETPYPKNYFGSYYYDFALIIRGDVAYVFANHYCLSRDYYYHLLYKTPSVFDASHRSFNAIVNDTSYIASNIWSFEDKIIYDRVKYNNGCVWGTTRKYDYAKKTTSTSNKPPYEAVSDITKGAQHDNIMVGGYSEQLFYSLNGGETFTIITVSTSYGIGYSTVYGSEDNGFYIG